MRTLALLTVALTSTLLGAAPVPKGHPKDEEAILGTWKVERFDVGLTLPAEVAGEQLKTTIAFKKDGKATTTEGSGRVYEGEYTLAAADGVTGVDFLLDGKPAALGIYELDGDTLTVCMSKGVPRRPAEYKADGKGTVVMTLRRVKEGK